MMVLTGKRQLLFIVEIYKTVSTVIKLRGKSFYYRWNYRFHKLKTQAK